MCDSFDQPKYPPSYLPASGVPIMHLEPAEGLQIGGGKGQLLIQGLLMEQVYPSTKMGGGQLPPALASNKSGIPSYSQNGSYFKPKKYTF